MNLIKKLVRASAEEDMIHLRAIKYGMKFPNGFMYEYFKKHYENRTNDWKIVNEFFQEAYNNKNGGSSRTTPFVLLEKMGNGNADKSKYILSYEAYFNYLSFRNSKRAIWVAVIAILISVAISSGVLFRVYNTQTNPADNSGVIKNEVVQNLNKENSSFVGEFKVVRVVDGDTIEIEGGERVRYIGIDTPETVDPRKPVQCFGVEASNKNKELVAGKTVRLEKDTTDRDKYNRLLRYVFVGNDFINLELVKQGFAYSYSYPPDIKYQDQILQAQQEAEKAKSGLWAACPVDPSKSADVSQKNIIAEKEKSEGDCTIKGNISTSGEKIYHLPGCGSYAKTTIDENRGERRFCTEADAQAAGWRKALNCP